MTSPHPTPGPAHHASADTIPATLDPPTTLSQAIRHIGPGLILAGAIVGTGELIATTNLGAKAGFSLLWLVILSCVIKVFVQIELGRYAISSGDATFTAFRKLPGPGVALVWWCSLMILLTQFQIGAMIGGVGQALHVLFPGFAPRLAAWIQPAQPALAGLLAERPELPWAVVATLATIALLASGSYLIVERGTTFLVVLFTLMTVGCVAFLPPDHAVKLADLAAGFRLRLPREHMLAAFTMFGITGVGASELLAYPYWCIEKGYARHVGPCDTSAAWTARARGWLRVLRLDAWVSMVIYLIATLAFFVLGAAVLHRETAGAGLPNTIGPVMDQLAAMYRPVLGQLMARWFIVIGAFAVLYSTLFAATAGNSRLLADAARTARLVPAHDTARFRAAVRWGCILLPLLSFWLFLVFKDPVGMVTVGGIMQAISLPLIAVGAVFLRYFRTDPRIRPGRLWDLGLWLSLAGLCLAASHSLLKGWDELSRLFNP